MLLLLVQGIITMGFSQESTEEFKPNGKPLALIFSNFRYTAEDGDTWGRFQIRRAYLGYEYNFSSNWYAKAVLDVGNPDDGGRYEFSAFLKNAYFRYKKNKFSASFGMVSTTQFKVSEKIWGYRYMLKSHQDAYRYSSSADLGFVLTYKFADFISADFAVYNGEGYQKLEADSVLRPALGITVNPIKDITARIYLDVMGDEVKQQSLAGFLAYTGEKLTVAGEYNYQKDFRMREGQDIYGMSFYATYKASNKIKVFARYDSIDSSTLDGEDQPWQVGRDGDLIMAGLEFAPIKGVKLTPNIRNWSYAEAGRSNRVDLFLNCEVKF